MCANYDPLSEYRLHFIDLFSPTFDVETNVSWVMT